ncbi:GAF and ANTAR domain-containing protein [Terrabacter aeriphilus]|uniref:GAF and ANTAR domain-containing protein n=1 Tax=Terrabacter aeriphilus TaxID=515662 RepID=A0ABP9J4N2_9MICO
MIAIDKLTDVFVAVADTLVADFDIIEFLELVAQKAATISAATAAGIVLGDPTGRLQFVAASEESVRLLEVMAVQSESGPCQDCFHAGEPVINPDLREGEARRRWPAFADLATSMGYQSVHALPLRHHGTAIGALTLLSVGPHPLEDADTKVVQAIADIATIGILQERSLRASSVLTEQLQFALVSRISIEQAKGILSRIHATSIDEAFTILRSYARRSGLGLSAVATDVVTHPERHPSITRTSAARGDR